MTVLTAASQRSPPFNRRAFFVRWAGFRLEIPRQPRPPAPCSDSCEAEITHGRARRAAQPHEKTADGQRCRSRQSIAFSVKRFAAWMSPHRRATRVWTSDEIEAYRKVHPIGSKARLVLELMLNVGARKSDACRIGRQHQVEGGLEGARQEEDAQDNRRSYQRRPCPWRWPIHRPAT